MGKISRRTLLRGAVATGVGVALTDKMGIGTVFATGFPIIIDGEITDIQGITKDGVTTVQLRQLAENLNCKVDFIDRKIIITTNKTKDKDSLKITALIENNSKTNKDLKEEFGFCAYIENGEDKIIFDTGQTGEFLNNAQKLDIDLSNVNALVLSHAHYDHCGGVLKYFDIFGSEGKTLYMKNSFFNYSDKKYYHDAVGQKLDFTDGTPGYFSVGIDFNEKDLEERNVMIEYLDTDSIRIGDNITLYGNFTPSNDSKMVVKKDGQYAIDAFEEEVTLAIDTNEGLVIISGCSHNGILNMVNTIQEKTGKEVYAVIGGFHLLDATEEKIQNTIDRFKELGIEKIGLSHCTGPKAIQMFLEQMPSQTFIFETGSVFEAE